MASSTSKRKPDMVTISHNGKLREMAEREGLVHVEIDLAEAPRYSLPYSLFASIAVLKSASLLQGIEWELDETVSVMKKVARSISTSSPFNENVSKQVGFAIHSHEPCVYTSSVTKSVARRFKNSLNENAKMHARFDSAPDFFHNEVEAWEDDDNDLMPVMLRRSREPSFEAQALDAFTAMLASRGVVATEVRGQGDGNLAQLMDLVYTLDFASYYAAMARGVDPFEISLIEEMKKPK
jgi:glucose/mannose-6-phosphate isomerase